MFWVFVACLSVASLEGGDAWKIFHHGRLVGGNNVSPRSASAPTLGAQEQWFTQKLDHFSPVDSRTWQQRYWMEDKFQREHGSGPVFIYIGGEGEVNATSTFQGQWMHDAEKYNALCFILEHRFYGKSHPLPSMSTKNLKYLSSEQALEDLSTFIFAMMQRHKLYTKWIAFGGSYPGSLAAWLRYKYPHLVAGAMSASGPLWAKLNFTEYFAVVESALRTHSDKCAENVQQGTKQIEIMLKHMVGQRQLNKLFRTCTSLSDSIENAKDISNFFETLSGNFAGVVQYNRDNREGRYAGAGKITVDTLCNMMVNASIGLPVARLAAVNTLLLDTYQQKCLDYKYDAMIKMMRQEDWNSSVAEGGRQWTYQTCTEFGFYQTSDHKPQLFGNQFPLEFFIDMCEDIFGPKFNYNYLQGATLATNVHYGSLELKVTNVVYVHGTIDPWHALGIVKTRNPEAPAILIEGTAHCANMYPPAENDLPALIEARQQVTDIIGEWLKQ